ncbi:MAG: organic hydroperoxide resistance protein [Gemmatimonadaceae bacterium]|nr:organic hydroperoxide resistance protein [Gemmatimonadaceae bacterium]
MPSLDKRLYRAQATATGGRDGGHAVTSDNHLDVQLSSPKEMGGPGGAGTNPEQLFAAGWSACFLGALKAAARKEKIAVPEDASIVAQIGFGPVGSVFGIDAQLDISLPGVPRETAERLVQAAHQICPYSNATRNNIDVTLNVV